MTQLTLKIDAPCTHAPGTPAPCTHARPVRTRPQYARACSTHFKTPLCRSESVCFHSALCLSPSTSNLKSNSEITSMYMYIIIHMYTMHSHTSRCHGNVETPICDNVTAAFLFVSFLLAIVTRTYGKWRGLGLAQAAPRASRTPDDSRPWRLQHVKGPWRHTNRSRIAHTHHTRIDINWNMCKHAPNYKLKVPGFCFFGVVFFARWR